MRHYSLLFLSLIAVALFHARPAGAQTCAVSANSDRNLSWKIDAQVTFYTGDATLNACRPYLDPVLTTWQSSMANRQFGVRFSWTTDPNAATVRVYRGMKAGQPVDTAGLFDSQPDPMADEFGQGLLGAGLWMSDQHQSCGAFARTFSHEVGHGFGLRDCYTCSNTIMRGNVGWNDTSSTTPTSCDISAIQNVLDPILQQERADMSSGGVCNKTSCPTGSTLNDDCMCVPRPDPLLIDLGGDGVEFTSAANGVAFDFDGKGIRTRAAWPSAAGNDAWLALDRNGNGVIDNGLELFGNHLYPNGFVTLAEFDRAYNGGNGDGAISRADAIFASLLVWHDANHDGTSQPGELRHLADAGVVSIALDYHESGRRDRFGNILPYRAAVGSAKGAKFAYDVFLTEP